MSKRRLNKRPVLGVAFSPGRALLATSERQGKQLLSTSPNERDRPVEIDAEASDVLAYMARNIPTSRLVGIADAVGKLAPLLWGHFSAEEVRPARLCYPAISGCGLRTPPTSTESRPVPECAGGGSEGEIA